MTDAKGRHMRLGGDPPRNGARFCQGYKRFGSLVTAEVVAVYDGGDEWAALVISSRRRRFDVVDHLDVHTDNWRPIERENEEPPR